MKKNPFPDPIEVKQRKTISNFAALTKEEATTGVSFMAGDDYGVGYRTPVGKMSASSKGPILYGCKRYDPNEIA